MNVLKWAMFLFLTCLLISIGMVAFLLRVGHFTPSADPSVATRLAPGNNRWNEKRNATTQLARNSSGDLSGRRSRGPLYLSYQPGRHNRRNAATVLLARNKTRDLSGGRSTGPPYLSYQPPGNGWNNQRIALENALVLAKLLNRTLLVHPLAPHALGMKFKTTAHTSAGYVAYNMLSASDLLPPAYFLDLQRMAQLVPVVAVNSSHPDFIRAYNNLSWKNVCHSAGFGYWVDRLPDNYAELEILSEQRFKPNHIWRRKCPEEEKRAKLDPNTPIVEYVSNLEGETSQMLYFEQGTLFGVQIRFTTRERALEGQKWVVNHVQYSPRVWKTVNKIAGIMGPFNAIHVRRNDHIDRLLTASYWLDRILALNFSTSLPLYVATDQYEHEWFTPFEDRGYILFSAQNFTKLLDFSFLPENLQGDYLGIHEQCICELAVQFIPSPASTFSAYILRRRGEVEERDGLMVSKLHTYWIGHQAHNDI